MTDERYDEISGTVEAVIYRNNENGYTVLRLDTGDEEPATAVGSIPYASPGEGLTLSGSWVNHASYGQQFQVTMARRRMPEGRSAIFDYLASGAVKGIGKKTAALVVARFGEETLSVIENRPELLAEIKGISERKAHEISAYFKTQMGIRILMEFLVRHGLRPELAMKLYKCYGENAMNALRENPYVLADSFFAADFGGADVLALELGFARDSEERMMAGVLYELAYNLGNGHTFIPRDKLVQATAALLELPPESCDRAVTTLRAAQRIHCEEIAGVAACYLPQLYEAERFVADTVKEMAVEADLPLPEGLIDNVAQEMGIKYAPEQWDAVKAAATGWITVLTGAPGTGKTTTVRAILALFEKMALKTALAAPTGRAAKRLSELTGGEAVTIHRLLGAGYSGDSDELVFEKCASNPLKADAVILDETSMVDILLADALLRALPKRCRLVLVGDADQLPSVGPGNFFSDLIRSGAVPTIRLTRIFRQAEESGIIRNAHKINRGEVLDLREKSQDFFFLSRRDPGASVETVLDLCARRLPENMGIAPQDIQVLSPFKRGEAGTINLNVRLQEALNPPAAVKREKKFGKIIFREGDKVMQIRNNYDIMWKKPDLTAGLGIFNGDIGQISKVDPGEEAVTVIFDDERQVSYPFEMLGELDLAYAMTVHKSQGSEYRAVIFLAEKGPPMLLCRKVLYTAVTRARALFIGVGDGQVMRACVLANRQQKRYSGVRFRLAGE